MSRRIKTAPLTARQQANAETLREERAHQQQLAQRRSTMPKPQKSPTGITRRRLDHDQLRDELADANKKANAVLDALRVASQREAQLDRADDEFRRQASQRFGELSRPRTRGGNR